MRRFSLQNWFVPLALLALVALTYGLFIPLLGLYGDDWPYLWVNHVFGSRGYIDFVAWDRPFSAWIYLLATPVLGESVWAYHLFLALLRWGNTVLLWWVLRLVWPERSQTAAFAAFLFVVYPGFRQQPVPLEFMLHFSTLALFLFSLGAMLMALRSSRRKPLWLAGALIGEAGMFGLEYFVGLELLRPVFLWKELEDQGLHPRKRLLKVLQNWLPYLSVLGVYLVWRVFFFKFPTYQPGLFNDLVSSPLAGIVGLAERILNDLVVVVVRAWQNTIAFPDTRRLQLVAAGTFLAGVVLVGLFFWLARKLSTNQEDKKGSGLLYVVLGLFALLIAGWPFWVTGLPVEVVFPWDRSTLAFIVGASLLGAGFVALFHAKLRPWVLALLVGLAVAFQAQNALSYRTESEKLRKYFWQLAWRAPGLKSGAIVMSENIPLFYYSDNGLTPPLNWTYHPAQTTARQIYNFFDVDERLGRSLSALEKDLPVQRGYRSFSFKGTSSDILLVARWPGSCLRVLSAEDQGTPNLPPKLSGALTLSNLDLIQTGANPGALPPVHLVGPEPERDWCYYFEKADLARQRGDWQTIVKLGDEAQAEEFGPSDPAEWLPFIEGYARAAKPDQALALSNQIMKQENLRPLLCKRVKDVLEVKGCDEE